MSATRTAICLAIAVGLWAPAAQAYPAYRRLFKANYGQAIRCDLCHSGGGGTERNPYGKAWQAAGERRVSFNKIEAFDSDGDGITNAEELKNGSNPGDKRSTPQRPGNTWAQQDFIPIPNDQLVLVMGAVDTLEASEPDLTPKQLETLTAGVGRIDEIDKYPTLYFGMVAGKRSAVAVFSEVEVRDGQFSTLVGMGTDGRIKKVALFRSGNDSGSIYTEFLKCFEGKTKSQLSEENLKDCPSGSASGPAIHALSLAVRKAMWTITSLYAKK